MRVRIGIGGYNVVVALFVVYENVMYVCVCVFCVFCVVEQFPHRFLAPAEETFRSPQQRSSGTIPVQQSKNRTIYTAGKKEKWRH